MTRYLFFNTSAPKNGIDPVKALSDARDPDVVLVPIDWTPASDTTRDVLLKSLGMDSISSLPCVVYFEPEHEELDPETGEKVTVEARWREHRFVEGAKADWTWAKIDSAIVERMAINSGSISRGER